MIFWSEGWTRLPFLMEKARPCASPGSVIGVLPDNNDLYFFRGTDGKGGKDIGFIGINIEAHGFVFCVSFVHREKGLCFEPGFGEGRPWQQFAVDFLLDLFC